MKFQGKAPRSKIQDPRKIQEPITEGRTRRLEFGSWIFPGSWILDLGSWPLRFGVYLGFGIWGLGFSPSSAQVKTTYQDHILPLIEANCSKCHNSEKKKDTLDIIS